MCSPRRENEAAAASRSSSAAARSPRYASTRARFCLAIAASRSSPVVSKVSTARSQSSLASTTRPARWRARARWAAARAAGPPQVPGGGVEQGDGLVEAAGVDVLHRQRYRRPGHGHPLTGLVEQRHSRHQCRSCLPTPAEVAQGPAPCPGRPAPHRQAAFGPARPVVHLLGQVESALGVRLGDPERLGRHRLDPLRADARRCRGTSWVAAFNGRLAAASTGAPLVVGQIVTHSVSKSPAAGSAGTGRRLTVP